MAEILCYECEYFVAKSLGDTYCIQDRDRVMAIVFGDGPVACDIPRIVPPYTECDDFKRKTKKSYKTK